jgi:hypothetical protein
MVVGFVVAEAGRPVAASRRATGRLRFIRLFMDLTPDIIFVSGSKKKRVEGRVTRALASSPA